MSQPRADAGPQRAPALPAGRYGPQSSGNNIMGKVVAAVLGLLMVGIIVAGAFTIYDFTSTDSISGEIVSVDAPDENTLEVIMTVSRDVPGDPVYCIVRAQDQSKGELGRREIFVPPSESGTVQVTTEVPTTALAFMADVYGCGTDVPAYLRR